MDRQDCQLNQQSGETHLPKIAPASRVAANCLNAQESTGPKKPEGAAMSINWIAEMSRISADVSRHERVGTERISNQSRNIDERARLLAFADRDPVVLI